MWDWNWRLWLWARDEWDAVRLGYYEYRQRRIVFHAETKRQLPNRKDVP